jgi:glucokinase
MNFAIGADIGGSHISCQLFNLENHQFIGNSRVRKTIDSNSSATVILDSWANAIREAAGDYRFSELSGIGFAMPGPFDYQNGIAWFKDVEKFNHLYGVNIRLEILKRFQLQEEYPVRFLNDAACFAIGESLQGEAAKYSRLLAVTLGTGFGTTFIENHKPVAGEYGIPSDGFLYRVPFRNSVADDYFSTRWFLKEHKALTGKEISGVKLLTDLAINDNSAAMIFHTFGSGLGKFLAPWLKGFDAGCLVIGGNISSAFPLFGKELQDEFSQAGMQLPVFISSMPEDAAIAGSAFLCDDSFYKQLLMK